MQCTNLLRVVQDEGRAWSLLQRGFGVVVEERKDLDSCRIVFVSSDTYGRGKVAVSKKKNQLLKMKRILL